MRLVEMKENRKVVQLETKALEKKDIKLLSGAEENCGAQWLIFVFVTMSDLCHILSVNLLIGKSKK